MNTKDLLEELLEELPLPPAIPAGQLKRIADVVDKTLSLISKCELVTSREMTDVLLDIRLITIETI